MKTFSLLFHVAITFAAVSCQQAYVGQYNGPVASYDQIAQQSNSASSASSSASASSSSQSAQQQSIDNVVAGPVVGPVAGQYVGPAAGQVVAGSPCTAVDPRGRTTYASDTIYSNKGEILIHRPAPIIVKRPPTRVVVNHPPLVVKPAPVVLHKPPPVVLRKVFVKQHPRPVKVEPVYVNVVKPPAEKYFVNEKAAQAAVQYRPYQAMQAMPPPRTPCEAAARQQYALQSGAPLQVQY